VTVNGYKNVHHTLNDRGSHTTITYCTTQLPANLSTPTAQNLQTGSN